MSEQEVAVSVKVILARNRVILVITTDDDPVLQPGQKVVIVPDDFDISGGPWKLAPDDHTKLHPTQEEVDTAFTPEPPEHVRILLAALEEVADDEELHNSVRRLALALKTLFTPRPVVP